MKAKFSLRMGANYPVVELCPDYCDLDGFDGRAEIHFLKMDIDTGRSYLAPFIRVNASLHHDMTPDHAQEWANVIEAAAGFAQRARAPYLEIADVFTEAWMWVDAWKQNQVAVS
jgi:hypothetical protein